jgi:hypothetical protein
MMISPNPFMGSCVTSMVFPAFRGCFTLNPKSMIDPNSAAFPSLGQHPFSIGLTKRDHFAAVALQGILAHEGPSHPENPDAMDNDISRAIAYADALISGLNKSAKGGDQTNG